MKSTKIIWYTIYLLIISISIIPIQSVKCIEPQPDWNKYIPEIDFEYDDGQIITSNITTINWNWFTENRIGNGTIFNISISILNSYNLTPQIIYNYSEYINIYEMNDSIELNFIELSHIYHSQSFLLIIEYHIYMTNLIRDQQGIATLKLYWNPVIIPLPQEIFQLPVPWYVFGIIFLIGGIIVGYGLYWINSCQNIDNALSPKCQIKRKSRQIPVNEAKTKEKEKINILLQKELFR